MLLTLGELPAGCEPLRWSYFRFSDSLTNMRASDDLFPVLPLAPNSSKYLD